MCYCWEGDPQKRPNFRQIYGWLKSHLRKSNPLNRCDLSVNPSQTQTSQYDMLPPHNRDNASSPETSVKTLHMTNYEVPLNQDIQSSSCSLETSVKTSHMSYHEVPAQIELRKYRDMYVQLEYVIY